MTDMPGETSHAALIAAIAAGRDRAAFAGLFSHYAPRVKTFLQRRGADAAQAEELAQEALLAVWRKAGQFDPARATAAAWIFATETWWARAILPSVSPLRTTWVAPARETAGIAASTASATRAVSSRFILKNTSPFLAEEQMSPSWLGEHTTGHSAGGR
ncbi:MAG: hypothetical protein B7Z74_02630 [Deltaproteobacteria bacterium 21-66-5]|nr:MAG: hypothetical protein B7Z74_02630 [Deltaproteobacteria bacterium 21-66-5]